MSRPAEGHAGFWLWLIVEADFTVCTSCMGRVKKGVRQIVVVMDTGKGSIHVLPPPRGSHRKDRLAAINQAMRDVFAMEREISIEGQTQFVDIDNPKAKARRPEETEEMNAEMEAATNGTREYTSKGMGPVFFTPDQEIEFFRRYDAIMSDGFPFFENRKEEERSIDNPQ